MKTPAAVAVLWSACWGGAGSAAPADSSRRADALRIVETAGVRGGLVVHVGCGDGALSAALRVNERYLVHGLDRDAAAVARARERIRSRGLYGRVCIRHWTGDRLPYADNLVNLLVWEDARAPGAEEIRRVLAPLGVACVRRGGEWARTVKPWPDAIDEWTHWLHDAGGNAVARDTVAGPPRRLQWLAGPLWSRHHNTVPSVSAIVSARGRLFTIVDEAPASMHGEAPDKWALVARDAFNGLELWRKAIPHWGWRAWSADWQCRFTQPTHISRRLVADGQSVYVTLGLNAPLTELDAATGQVRRTFEDTQFTDEILLEKGLLVLSLNKAAQGPGAAARKGPPDKPPVRKWVAAVEADSGKMLWRTGDYVGLRSKTGSMERISHLSMAAGDGRVFFVDGKDIVSLALKDGREAWRAPRPPVDEHKMRYNIRITDMCSLVYHGGVVFFAQLDPDRRIDWREVRGRLHAFSADTGKELWSRPCASWGWGHPADVFVLHGLVWVHDFRNPFVLGLDPATGQVRRKVSNEKAFDNGHHHRCYRNKATARYLMTSYRGLEFVEWGSGRTLLHHWVRGTCRLGAIPCNGLIYATPHPCDCYITSKLNGLVALAPAAPAPGAEGATARLEKGPAYGHAPAREPGPDDADWPTYRHDAARTGATTSAVGPALRVAWRARVPGRPSACVVAEGKVLLASVTTHQVQALDAASGRRLWQHTAGGPVDTPPTVHRGRVVFGCTDGWVSCLRARDGVLAWRFRGAPSQRLVGAFGGIESAWPIHGSVLARDGVVYFTAGRSSFLDGGIRAFALDARTAKVISEKVLRTPYDLPVGTGRDASVDTGLLSDVLVSHAGSICMRQRRLLGGSGEAKGSPQLRSTAGLLDGSWFSRTRWFLNDRPYGELLVHDAGSVYGARARAGMSANGGFFRPGRDGYELFAASRLPGAGRKPARAGKRTARAKRPPTDRWSVRVPVRLTSMVLAGETLFAAGTPDVLDTKDAWAAYEGRRGGVLLAVSAAEGTVQARYKLDAPPVLDGLAAARGRLYAATASGEVLCFEPRE